MIPVELKVDKEGLLYTKDKKIIRENSLLIDNRFFENDRYYQNGFYPLSSTDEYIVKYSYTPYMKQEREAYKEMLFNLVNKQKDVPDVDFPIGYFRHRRKLAGLIVPYYKNGISCDNIFKHQDINEIKQYYYHDEDDIRNLFLLLEDVLNLIYEMFENGVYYSDINSGNLVLTDNQVKIIDFDPRFVKFKDKDKRLEIIMMTYNWLIREVMKYFDFPYYFVEDFQNFEHVKVYTKKLENRVRNK